jgi:hypothetical protein
VRRLLAAATISAILLIQAFPASAAAPGRVVLVTLDGTRSSEWGSPDLPHLAAIMERGAVGLLSTRTAVFSENPRSMRHEAYETLGRGYITRRSGGTTLLSSRLPTPLAVAAPTSAGEPGLATILGGTPIVLPQQIDEAFPGGARVHVRAAQAEVDAALATARALVVDLGDTARVERELGTDPPARGPWMRLAMARADAFIGWVRGRLTADDTLIVAALTPPLERQHARRFLGAVAMIGPGVRPGLLTSASTEREGVVTISDLAPTILRRAGVEPPSTMTGEPFRVVARGNGPDALASLERDLVHASIVRGPLMRGTVIVGSALAVLALLTVLAGRGRAGPPRGIATTWRATLDTALLAIASTPLVLFVEPLFGTETLTQTAITVAAVALGASIVLRFAVGSRRAIAGVLTVTAAAILVDVVAGGPLAERSPLSYLIAEGARFHGIGNDAMGVVIGAALFAAAAFLDRRITTRRAGLVAGALAGTAVVMAAPQLGAKFGSVPAAVPAFALFAFLATGRRLDLRALIGIAIVTVLAAGLVVAVDALRESGTHVARAVGGGGEVLGRKAGAAGRLLALSYWMAAILAAGGSLALLAWRRPVLLGRGLWGRPSARRALACAAVAAAGCIGANDAGVTAAAWIALLAAASAFSALLVPSDP